MTTNDYEKLITVTQKALYSSFGSMGDLPYEFADAIANIFWRCFEQGLVNAPEVGLLEMKMRQSEFEAAPGLVDGIRQLRIRGVDESTVKAMAFYFVNICKYRMPDADSKTPIRCMIERKFRKHQDIPDLARKLGVYP